MKGKNTAHNRGDIGTFYTFTSLCHSNHELDKLFGAINPRSGTVINNGVRVDDKND